MRKKDQQDMGFETSNLYQMQWSNRMSGVTELKGGLAGQHYNCVLGEGVQDNP